MIPHEPQALYKHMRNKGVFEVDQFPYRDWESEKKEIKQGWDNYRESVMGDVPNSINTLNFRNNLIDYLSVFKRFHGDEHEVVLTQVDTVPGDAKLVYRNHERKVGTMVRLHISSYDALRDEVELAAKELSKKAKKL